MNWGGAPPWVYKNEAAYAQNDAFQARSESSKAKAEVKVLVEKKEELTKQLDGILSEITKYEERKSNKVTKKEMKEILETIAKIVKDSKNNSS